MSHEAPLYMTRGEAWGQVRLLSAGWYEIAGVPFPAQHSLLRDREGDWLRLGFSLDPWQLPNAVELLPPKPPGERGNILHVWGYIDPAQPLLHVPFEQPIALRERLSFPLPPSRQDLPLHPGRRYALKGQWDKGGWVLSWERELPICWSGALLDLAEEWLPTASIQVTHPRHLHFRPLPHDLEPLRAHVAAHQELPHPLLVAMVENRPQLVDGVAALQVAKLWKLPTVPVLFHHQPFSLKEAIPPMPPILYEDQELLVLDKPAGLIMHPPYLPWAGVSLIDILLKHVQSLSQGYWRKRRRSLQPGLIHRLDTDTSGLVVVCKSERAFDHLYPQFANHSFERRYLAIAWCQNLPDTCTFNTGHAREPQRIHRQYRYTGRVHTARRAITEVRVLERFANGFGLVECILQTGRSHQIRMHLSEAGAPLLGDLLYGNELSQNNWISRQALHAYVLGFDHPTRGWMRFEQPPPEDFQRALEECRRTPPANRKNHLE